MKRLLRISGLVLLLNLTFINAQDDLNIFGYYQGYFLHSSEYQANLPINPFLNNGNPVFTEKGQEVNSFLLQQLNLFFQKDFSGDFGEFSTFVNFEITNSYSSSKNWGSYNLEEAWVKYSMSDAFNVKMGHLIPKFNAMNEIKNRTPLFPYMFRPLVYETYVQNIINIEDFIPEKAFLQVYGELDLSDNFIFHYAAYVGNSESSFLVDFDKDLSPSGTDFSKNKMFGGRIGIEHEMFTLGVSGVTDRDNQADIFGNHLLTPGNLSGITMNNYESSLKRTKFGMDFSFNYKEFALEAEYIKVSYDMSAGQENHIANYRDNIQLAVVSTGGQAMTLMAQIEADPTNPLNVAKALKMVELNDYLQLLQDEAGRVAQLGSGYEKDFFYVNASYNVTEKLQIFSYYSETNDKHWIPLENGMTAYSAGFAFRPVYSITFKGQYIKTKADDLDFDMDLMLFGFSVLF